MKKCTKCNRYENNDQMLYCKYCGGALTKSENSIDQPVSSNIRYCVNCGTPMNEYGVCPKCGYTVKKRTSATYGSSILQYFTKPKDYFLSLFSASPFNGIENAGRETTHTIWPTYSVAFILLNALGLTKLIITIFNGIIHSLVEVLEPILGSYYYSVESEIFSNINENYHPFGRVFLAMSLISIVILLCSTTLLKLPLLNKQNVSFVQLLNLNSFAMTPITIAGVLTFIACLFGAKTGLLGASVFLVTGIFASIITVYYGLQKITRFEKSPFWIFLGVFAIDIVMVLLSFGIVIKGFIGNIIG